MKLKTVIKNYTPGFFSALFAAILVAIFLGQNPINLPWFIIFVWFSVLFMIGVLVTWVVLLVAKD